MEIMNREEALRKAAETVKEWPVYLETYRGGLVFGNWRFIDTLPTREIVLGNCIEPGITESEWRQARNAIIWH